MVIQYCNHNLNRLNKYAYPHHKVGGIDGLRISDFTAVDTFSPLGKKYYALHAINLHSRASVTRTLRKAPTGKDATEFLEHCKGRGILGRCVLSDQGKEFDSTQVREYLQMHGSAIIRAQLSIAKDVAEQLQG
ncbi:unnamed protein product [Amoebophrya sp. A25]|nr:unnamed protein product [Amoebophrya sp. A25]|eukprot:GSA25T00024814001.1